MPDIDGAIQVIAPLVATLSYLGAALRLATFRRTGHNYKWRLSLLASVMIGVLLCAGLEIVLYSPPVSPFQAALSVMMFALTLRARGNVSCLMRMRA